MRQPCRLSCSPEGAETQDPCSLACSRTVSQREGTSRSAAHQPTASSAPLTGTKAKPPLQKADSPSPLLSRGSAALSAKAEPP